MNNGIEIIAESQQQLRSDVNALKAELKNGLANVKEELSEIKYKLDRKVSYDDFEKLEKSVFKLENASA